MFNMNRLSREQRIRSVAALVEGNSLRATARMVGVARNTVTSLLVDLGFACARYQDEHMRNLPCKRLQADEIWSFCYSKAKNVPTDKGGQFGYGDVWTWTAICADTKLIPTWYVGDIHDRYLSRMDAVIRILPSAGALSSAVTLRSPSVFANQVARSTSHVTRHPCARIGSPHRTGRGTVAEDSVWVFRPAGLETEIRTHQKFPRKLPANSFA